jgi:hypothetical protein
MLSLSHANVCNPLLQARPPWAQDNTSRGSLFPPCVPSRADPSGLGHAATIYSSVQGPPGVETPTNGTCEMYRGISDPPAPTPLPIAPPPASLEDVAELLSTVSWYYGLYHHYRSHHRYPPLSSLSCLFFVRRTTSFANQCECPPHSSLSTQPNFLFECLEPRRLMVTMCHSPCPPHLALDPRW